MRKTLFWLFIAASVAWSIYCAMLLIDAHQLAFDAARSEALEAIRSGASPFGITPQGVYANMLAEIAVKWAIGFVIMGAIALILRPRKSRLIEPRD
ncbi:MAG TPA: hypothetical protein VG821_06925 [Rhizomicrobium sp.]|nr:hypothetical protein [Rhizomicrobium sp.]